MHKGKPIKWVKVCDKYPEGTRPEITKEMLSSKEEVQANCDAVQNSENDKMKKTGKQRKQSRGKQAVPQETPEQYIKTQMGLMSEQGAVNVRVMRGKQGEQESGDYSGVIQDNTILNQLPTTNDQMDSFVQQDFTAIKIPNIQGVTQQQNQLQQQQVMSQDVMNVVNQSLNAMQQQSQQISINPQSTELDGGQQQHLFSPEQLRQIEEQINQQSQRIQNPVIAQHDTFQEQQQEQQPQQPIFQIQQQILPKQQTTKHSLLSQHLQQPLLLQTPQHATVQVPKQQKLSLLQHQLQQQHHPVIIRQQTQQMQRQQLEQQLYTVTENPSSLSAPDTSGQTLPSLLIISSSQASSIQNNPSQSATMDDMNFL